MNSKGAFNVRGTRLIIFTAVAVLHIALILLVTFRMETTIRQEELPARMISLFELEEEVPSPPPPPPMLPVLPQTSEQTLAERIIEAEEAPPPSIFSDYPGPPSPVGAVEQITYLRMHELTKFPVLPEDQIARNVVYPQIAQLSRIGGTVALQLFIDPHGNILDIRILAENPPHRGFGEAAVNAFRGIRAEPGEADGFSVASQIRYNFTFRP